MNKKVFIMILFLGLLICKTSTQDVYGQSVSANCKEKQILDSDKRDFGDKKSFKLDVDGDGKLDSITPRTYKMKSTNKSKPKIKETHWITFDLKTSKGKTLKSFFKYEYGTNLADYWVYALVTCDSDKDGQKNLIFYTGDDTSDETIILGNRETSFKTISRKTSDY